MGMRGPISRSHIKTYDCSSGKAELLTTGNPDPTQFRIDRHEELGDYLILLVVYRGVKNYEGKKVMVFKDLTWKKASTLKSLDPHFSDNKKVISPIARFEPTVMGWTYAKRFCNSLIN